MGKRTTFTEEEIMEKMKTLGGRIFLARAQAGMTQSDLAKELNCNDQTISNYENNINTEKISYEQIVILCKVLDIDFDYLSGKITHSTKELETVCNYTGLSEKAAKKLHEDNNQIGYNQIPQMISNLLSNYYLHFSGLIFEIFRFLLFKMEEKSVPKIELSEDWTVVKAKSERIGNAHDSSSIALFNCLQEIQSMQELAKKDKMIQEQISLRHSFKTE